MEAYENGGHAYHATMPTDGLKNFRDVMKETQGLGFEAMKEAQIELGKKYAFSKNMVTSLSQQMVINRRSHRLIYK